MATPASPLSPIFLGLLQAEPLAELTVLDVGTGRGRLALELAPRCRRVIGIDREGPLVEQARARAAGAGLANVEFRVADAEAVEYAAFAPDLVAAHLCLSDPIIERAGRALAPGRVFAALAFHTDQWRETGRPSRFAYDEERARTVLAGSGLEVEHLEVERQVQSFGSLEEGLAEAIGLEERWKTDGRWVRYLKFLEEGGRTLTRSHLIVKARRR